MNMAHALSSTRPAWRLAALLALMLAALILLPAITLANSPPTTPASVTVSRSGVTLTVIWDTPAGATKYHATYSSDGGNSWTAIGDNLTGNGIGVGNTDPSKPYIVAVRAGNDHGWSGWRNSAPIQPAPPPATPGSITVTRADGSLTAIWDAVENATKYHVTYSSNNGGSWQAPSCGDNCSNNVTISVDNAKTYIVAVRAGNDSGWSGWRNSAASGPYGPQPPATPGTITVTRADGTITATWDAVANADIYHINYSSDNKNSWQSFDDEYNLFTITRNVDNSKTYYIAIRAGNVSGNETLWSGWRTSAAVGPYGPQPPATPASVSVSRANGTLTASGYGVSGATKYHITYSSNNGGNWTAASSNHSGTSITISGVDNAKPYIVAVRAGNTGGWSGWRNSAAIDPLPPTQPPAAPASITTERVCDDKFTVTWTPSPGATGYDLNYSTTNRKSWHRALSNEPHAVWIFAVWSKDKTYTLSVRARNSAGVSGWKDAAAAPPPPCEVGNLRAVTSTTHGTAGGSITTTWDAAKRANAYNVNYSVDGGQSQRIATNQSATTHTGTVTATGNHTVSVQSTNGGMGSQWRSAGVAWLSVGGISASGATLTIAGHSGDWYVKKTAPTPAGTCSAAITGTTHAYTVTDGGTAQTVTAYSDAACANPVASVTFTAADPTLTVSNITASGATLTIAGHSGDWHYKHTTPSNGTCSAAVSGSTATLTALDANTEYIFKAYSDSACATEVAAAAGFFTGETVSNLASTGDVAVSVGQETDTLNIKRAASFRTGSRSRGYTLKSVTVHMPAILFSPTSFTAAIHAVSGGNPAASATHTLSGAKPNSSGNHTFTCSGGCALNADTDYFLVLSATGADYNYFLVTHTTSSAETVTPANAGWSIANQGKKQTNGGSWTDDTYNSSPLVLAFELRASVNTELSAGSLTYTTATLSIAGHSGSWYYKANTGPDSSACSSAVSGTSKVLTGLSQATSYVYTAYSDSACATSLVAADAFTLPAASLDGSASSYQAGTLTISGWSPGSGKDGNWHYKRSAPTSGSCSAAQTAASASLSGLTPNTDYTYKAYSDSGCTTAKLLATGGVFTGDTVGNLAETRSGSSAIGKLSSSNIRHAVGFTTGSKSGGYDLRSITIKTEAAQGSPTGLTAAVHAAASNGNPATTASITLSGGNPTTAGEHALTCSGDCALDADTDYFLVLSLPGAAANTNYKLVLTASNSETVAPSNAGWSIANRGKIDITGNTWVDGNIGQIEIKADARLLSAHSVTTSSATLHLADYSGNWHYKYTSPPGGTCSSVQTGSAAALSALTTGTTYTFKAYSDSGCTTEIGAARTFTTGVSVSNFPASNRSECGLSGGSSCATAFTTGSASGGYSLQSVTVGIGVSAGGSILRAAVHAASGGNPAASALIDLGTFSQPTQGSHTLTCDANCGLSADTTYFLVLSDTPNQSGQRQWGTTAADSETKTPSDNGWSIADAGKKKASGGAWSSFDDSGLFRVKAHEGAGLGATAVTLTGATLNISNHAGGWWYKRVNPTGDTTCGSVGAGTSTAALSSLTKSTSYTYKAYDKSGCADADEIAEVTFTTLAYYFSAGAPGATTVALTLNGQAGDWRYKRSAPTTGSCSAAVSTATANLTSLGTGTTYTYKAYADATCATEVGAVSFTTTAPTLTVTSVTHGSATLTIGGWTPSTDGNWHYKHTSPSNGSCSAAQTGATATLSLDANTDYTFKAYSDSACATEIAAADAFSTAAILGNLGDTDDEATTVRRTSQKNRSVAAGFRAGSQSGGYTLKSIAVDVEFQLFQPDTFSMAIHEASGGVPAAAAEFVVSSALISGTGRHTVTCSGTCSLAADTDYFLVLKATATGFNNFDYRFTATKTNNVTASPASDGWSISDQGKFRQDDGNWQDDKTNNNEALVLKFELKADVNPALSATSVSAGGATLNLSHHTAAWWYKRTTPSGDDTCHSVAAGTTTASLSSLTASTDYTYKAYDTNGCGSADEIAAVTFTTPGS